MRMFYHLRVMRMFYHLCAKQNCVVILDLIAILMFFEKCMSYHRHAKYMIRFSLVGLKFRILFK